MIKIIAKCVIKNDKTDEFKVIGEKLVDATRANDKGCISYELFQDAEAKNVFVFVETWENIEAVGLHAEKPHFKDAVAKITAISETEMAVNVMNLVK